MTSTSLKEAAEIIRNELKEIIAPRVTENANGTVNKEYKGEDISTKVKNLLKEMGLEVRSRARTCTGIADLHVLLGLGMDIVRIFDSKEDHQLITSNGPCSYICCVRGVNYHTRRSSEGGLFHLHHE